MANGEYWMDECRVEECTGEPCTFSKDKHWVVFSESGAGMANFFSEEAAKQYTDQLNATEGTPPWPKQ